MRRVVCMLVATCSILMMSAGTALADTINCLPPVASSNTTCTGTLNDDDMFGTSSNDSIAGLAGNDRMAGYEGTDVFYPGFDNDLVLGGPGTDWYLYDDRDWGQDHIVEEDRDWGHRGALRFDNVVTDELIVALTFGSAYKERFGMNGSNSITWDPPHAITIVYGGQQNDYIDALIFTPMQSGTYLRGMGGDDEVIGGDGGDTLYGDIGADTIQGAGGPDSIYGGEGDDELTDDRLDFSFRPILYNDGLYGEGGDDTLRSLGAPVRLTWRDLISGRVRFRGGDALYGHEGNDTLIANNGYRERVIDCGRDWDKVYYDVGLDPTPFNCEEHNPL